MASLEPERRVHERAAGDVKIACRTPRTLRGGHERARAGRPLAVMLSPAISLLGVFVAAPMALTIWLAFQDWSTETGFGEARFVGFDNFVRDLRFDLGRPRLQGRAGQHDPLHACLGRGDPAAVGRARTAGLSAARQGRRHAPDHPVLDLHGADDRGGACLVEALFAEEGPINQILGWVGPAAGSDGCRRRIPRSARSCFLNVWQQVGYFTVLAVAGLTQIPGGALRGGRARRRRSAAALRLRDPAAVAAHAAVLGRHRDHQRGSGVRAGGADHAGRAGRLDQRSDLPHPPRRHRTRRRAGLDRRWRSR